MGVQMGVRMSIWPVHAVREGTESPTNAQRDTLGRLRTTGPGPGLFGVSLVSPASGVTLSTQASIRTVIQF